MVKKSSFAVVVLLAVCSSLFAAELPALPEPLTLSFALSAVDENHPLIAEAAAQRDLAEANLSGAKAKDDASLDLSLQARRVNPVDHSLRLDTDDSRANLTLRKTLYDFGRTGHSISAGEVLLEARTTAVALTRQRQRQQIMRRYFDVMLSDLDAARANEAMSIAFVRFDNAKEQLDLGEISDIDALQLQNTYQEVLMQRNRAQDSQRQTRAQLALAMNRPDDLVDTIEPPELPGNTNPLPDYDELLKEMQQNNLTLRAAALERESRQESRKSAKAEGHPEIFLQLEAAEYQRDFRSREPLKAILGLDVPLYRGARTRSDVARASAEIAQLDAQTRRTQYLLRQELLELWQSVATLMRQLEQAKIQNEFRDLDLDRSRARYELELATNFGDAMTQQSAARLFSARTEYQLALAREQLAELTQNPAYSALAPKLKKEEPQ